MLETQESRIINDWLAQFKIPLSTQPLFRLSWSEDLYELRRSDYPIYHGPIIIGHSERIKEVKKYNWIKDRWILEQWIPPDLAFCKDLPETKNGDYTAIYVFETSSGVSLALRLSVVQIIVKHILSPSKSMAARYSDMCAALDVKENNAEKIVEAVLNDESYLVSQFHSGSAILNAFDIDKDKK